jgi:hypothetical protein
MEATTVHQAAPISNPQLWTGRVLTALPGLFLLFDAVVKILQLAPAMEGTARVGYPQSVVFGLGVVELACVIAYLVPRTAVLGAILLTGYLGGATATHLRIGEPFWFPVLFGVIVWAGLFLREERLRALLPLRKE